MLEIQNQLNQTVAKLREAAGRLNHFADQLERVDLAREFAMNASEIITKLLQDDQAKTQQVNDLKAQLATASTDTIPEDLRQQAEDFLNAQVTPPTDAGVTPPIAENTSATQP